MTDDNFDAILEELQERIFEQTRRAFGEKVYQRWQEPLYMGMLDDADGKSRVRGPCGDTMEIYLKFESNKVVDASFMTDGCGPTAVCGSYAAEMALGSKPDDIFDITGESILTEIGGLPEEHEHCAFLAAEALQAAVDDYMIQQARKSDDGKGTTVD
jgi:nitrogen fixation NifU-like protein